MILCINYFCKIYQIKIYSLLDEKISKNQENKYSIKSNKKVMKMLRCISKDKNDSLKDFIFFYCSLVKYDFASSENFLFCCVYFLFIYNLTLAEPFPLVCLQKLFDLFVVLGQYAFTLVLNSHSFGDNFFQFGQAACLETGFVI